MQDSHKLVCSLLLLAGSFVTAQTDPRGLYVYSWDVASSSTPSQSGNDVTGLVGALSAKAADGTPLVDGITLVQDWSEIETQPGHFVWMDHPAGKTRLDLWIQQAVDAGKHINLAIRAGDRTPCWLFTSTGCLNSNGNGGTYLNAAPLNFVAAGHQGGGNCVAETLAAPWDGVFLSSWDSMLTSLSAYLKSVPYGGKTEYDAITMVRITGLNRTTDEFRLPEEILTTGCPATASGNDILTWLNAGYRPSLLLSA